MSVRVSTLVWGHSRAVGPTFLLLLALADQANDEGYCWPKRRTLARRLRLKEERSVSKLAAKAVEIGELTILPRFSDGRQISNAYQINLAHLRTQPDLWGEGVQMDKGGCPNEQGEGVQTDKGGGVQTDRVITVNTNRQKNQPPKQESEPLVLPEWLPEETWQLWLDHRAEQKKPVTPTSAKMLFKKLEGAKDKGHDPTSLIETAIARGWQGIVIPDQSPSKGSAPRRPQNQQQANDKFIQGVQAKVDAVRGVFDD